MRVDEEEGEADAFSGEADSDEPCISVTSPVADIEGGNVHDPTVETQQVSVKSSFMSRTIISLHAECFIDINAQHTVIGVEMRGGGSNV